MPCRPGYKPAPRIDSLSSGECVKEGMGKYALAVVLIVCACWWMFVR